MTGFLVPLQVLLVDNVEICPWYHAAFMAFAIFTAIGIVKQNKIKKKSLEEKYKQATSNK